MSNKIFAQGIFFQEKHANAPSFILGDVSFKVSEAIEFLKKYKNDKGFVNITLKISQGGKKYFELNQYKKVDTGQEGTSITPEQIKQLNDLKDRHNAQIDENTIDSSSIPF